jgi:hypothetical protein
MTTATRPEDGNENSRPRTAEHPGGAGSRESCGEAFPDCGCMFHGLPSRWATDLRFYSFDAHTKSGRSSVPLTGVWKSAASPSRAVMQLLLFMEFCTATRRQDSRTAQRGVAPARWGRHERSSTMIPRYTADILFSQCFCAPSHDATANDRGVARGAKAIVSTPFDPSAGRRDTGRALG